MYVLNGCYQYHTYSQRGRLRCNFCRANIYFRRRLMVPVGIQRGHAHSLKLKLMLYTGTHKRIFELSISNNLRTSFMTMSNVPSKSLLPFRAPAEKPTTWSQCTQLIEARAFDSFSRSAEVTAKYKAHAAKIKQQ